MQSLSSNSNPAKLTPSDFGSAPPVVLRPGANKNELLGGSAARDERSLWLGKALSRNAGEPGVHPLGIWHGPSLGQGTFASDESDGQAVFNRRVEELLSGLPIGQYPAVGWESSKSLAVAITRLLRWGWERTYSWNDSIREACLLKPLMPLFLCSARATGVREEDLRTCLTQTRQLALELIAMVELGRSLEHVGFSDWLTLSARGECDLGRSLQQGLNVELLALADALGQKALGTFRNEPCSAHGAYSISELDHQRWWSFALQWSRARTALVVPIGLPEMSLSWSELANRWRTLREFFGGVDRPNPSECIEVWNSDDSQMCRKLEHRLDEVRSEKGTMSLVCIRCLGSTQSHPASLEELAWWQTTWLERIGPITEGTQVLCFLNPSNDMNLVYRNLNRNDLSHVVRELLSELQERFVAQHLLEEGEPVPMIVGIASVEKPARSFRTSQLIDAAGRCLINAASQGPGTIKSIEVF